MDLKDLIAVSRFYGAGNDFTIAGGGNTSVKDRERIAIKASGVGLRDITEAGFVELSREGVRRILSRTYAADPFQREAQIKADLMACRSDPEKGGRPSVETSLHEMIELRFIVHTHPWCVNALTCARDGEKTARSLFGEDMLWVPYTDPGYRLAKLMEEKMAAYRKSGRGEPKIILMQNHGLVVGADTIDEVKKLTSHVVDAIKARFRSRSLPGTFPCPRPR